MKPSKWITAAQAVALSCLLALGAVGCMVTGFGLPLESFRQVVKVCALAALFCAAAFSLKHGGFLVLLAGMLGAGYLYHRTGFIREFWQLVYRISHFYDNAYHWGVFKLVDTAWDAGAADLPMLVLGVAIAAVTARSVCRGTGAFTPVILSFLALLTCMVVTDTVPEPKYLYLLLLGQLLLLLTNSVRKNDLYQGDRLTFMIALPTAVLLGLLFAAVPQEGYVDRTEVLREKIVRWLQDLPGENRITQEETADTTPREEPVAIDLRTVGRRWESAEPVLDVEAETGGSLYLRSQDYDVYEGTGWRAEENRVEAFGYPGIDLGYVAIDTRQVRDHLCLPYYPRDGLSLIGGKYGNLRIEKSYSFIRQGLPDNWQELAGAGSGAPADESGRYLGLPEGTRAEAEALTAPVLTEDMTTADKARAIGALVRDSARYDRNTDRMPGTAEDFALWFLRESETGYCIHFATAATVLLRAAGIEARYVSGYLVNAAPGEPVTVTGKHAHAWAEYYEPGLGTWLVLEATPSDGLPANLETQTGETVPLTLPTEATEPQTEAPTVQPPSQPTFETVEVTLPQDPVSMDDGAGPGAWVKTAAWLLAFVLFTEGQRRLRLWVARCRRTRGTPNRRCLSCWREAERLSKHLKERPPQELKALAQKARFSQHTISKEELACFGSFLSEAQKRLEQRPWYRKLLDRYLFALY